MVPTNLGQEFESLRTRQIATIRYKTANNRVVFNDGFWRKADIRTIGDAGFRA